MATERMLEFIDKYTKELEELWETVDSELVETLVGNLSSILWDRDKTNVAATDPAELATVKKNFVENKLGVTGPDADTAIEAVCAMMKGDRTKSRVVFYYLLCKKLGKSV
jgi:hypothetical protein